MGTGKRPHEPTAEESGEFTEGIGDWAKDVEFKTRFTAFVLH